LRIRQVNLITAGAGSSLAFDIMRQYPRLLRSVAIAGPVPPDVGDFSAIANLSTSLDRYSSLCAAQASCHTAFPDILGQIQKDYDEFQQHPVTESVSLQPGAAPIPVLVDGQSGATAAAAAMAGPGITVIASELYNPDPALIATSVAAYNLGTGDYVWGQLASFECKDVLPGVSNTFRLEEQANSVAYPQLAGADSAAQLDLRWCQVWKVQPDNPNDFAPIVSSIPTFLFGAALDPYESSAWVASVAQQLSDVASLVFPTFGTENPGVLPACLTALRLEFFRHPEAHPNVSKCETQSPPIAFAGT
jgi:hypothetical protein